MLFSTVGLFTVIWPQDSPLALPSPAGCPVLQPSTPHTACSPRGEGQVWICAWRWSDVVSGLKQMLPWPKEAHSGHKSGWMASLSLRGRRSLTGGGHGSHVGGCWAGQIAPQCLLSRRPEPLSFYKHGFHFHTDVCGCDKYTTGRQKHDIKAKSILQKMLPGVQGASESRVSHLSAMVREADGALWRSIK